MEKETVHGRSFRLPRGQYGYKARDKSPSVQRGSNEAAARKRECLLFWLLAAAICVMRLWHISDLHAPFLLDDEIGYWSHAANLAGLSWTGVESLWYSYGYSLLLVPLFWVSHNMEILYRLAIAENALLGVLGFWAGYHLILELDEDFDRTIAIFISFVAASYSAYVFQSNIAWSETFVYAWFLVTALQAVRFCKRPTCLNTILLTAATVLLYIIHNRTLAIWIALLLTFLYMLIRRRISWKYVVLAAGILVIAYMANQQMKGYLTALMLGSGGELKGNSVSSQSGKFALLTSFAGIKRLLQSLAGKCWYLLSSTLLVGYAGMVYLLKAFAAGITGKQSASCEGKERTGQEGQNGQRALMWQDCAALFLILSVLGTVALATLTSVPKTIEAGGSYDRLDVLFYGRYSDMISGLLILTGLMYLYRYSHRCKSVRAVVLEMLPGVLIYGVCFAAVQAFLDNLGSYVINIPCVPGVFFLRFDNFTISFIKITAIAAALFFLIFLGFFLFRHRLAVIGVKVRCILVGCGMTGVFLVTSWNGYRTYISLQQSYNYTCYSEATEVLNANTEFEIYSLNSDRYYTFRQHMRVTVVDGDISYGVPGEDEENYFLTGDYEALETLDFTAKQYYYIMTVEDSLAEGDVYILAVGDEIRDKLEDEGYVCTLMTEASDAKEGIVYE